MGQFALWDMIRPTERINLYMISVAKIIRKMLYKYCITHFLCQGESKALLEKFNAFPIVKSNSEALKAQKTPLFPLQL